ncbi:hypothetical protein AGMMS49975_12030 [Clostridia bacterium]|nr:hypothetical protein AGMMS49975_12030 [Clostridia bacterium]
MTKRISKRKLGEYNRVLSERDKAILRSLKECRFLKTGQVQRLHFGDAATPSAALRAASRALTRLQRLGLIQSLRRRIGGVRAGSSSYVWTLKTAGAELLRLNAGEPQPKPRKRVFEPTHIFLKHTIGIAELYTRLHTTTSLVKAELEPSCWRGYATRGGENITVRPDLYAVTASDGFEDHWFFEIDLDTEAPSRIIRKCALYGSYCLEGSEQRRIGVFPRVVWVVPDEKRRETLWRHICEHLSEYTDLFAVITFDGLDELVSSGAAPVTDSNKIEHPSMSDNQERT